MCDMDDSLQKLGHLVEGGNKKINTYQSFYVRKLQKEVPSISLHLVSCLLEECPFVLDRQTGVSGEEEVTVHTWNTE